MLKPSIDKGDIKVVGEQYTDGWLPENAQRNMEQILTANNNKVDAVVASNDGTAGGAIAALSAQGLQGIPGFRPGRRSGRPQPRRARSSDRHVWKDARELGKNAAEIAVEMAKGTEPAKIKGATKWADGAKHVPLDTIFLTPIPITQDNLNLVIDAGWVKKDVACQGVDKAKGPKACQ